MTPTLPDMLTWLAKQKNANYNFESPTDCVVARWVNKTQTDKLIYRFEGGNWSSIFPGQERDEQLRSYHFICNQKPMDYAGVIARSAQLESIRAEKQQ